MNAKPLHIIFLINALWLLSSCSSQDPSEDDLGKGAEVTFSVADQSRTAMVSDLEYPGSCFAIFGDMKMIYKDNKLKDDAPTTIFNNIPVTYRKEPEAGWFYDNTQYWFPSHEHSFVAIHPYGAVAATYGNSTLSVTYTLPEDFSKTADILAATYRKMYNSNYIPGDPVSPVPLHFFHTMSRIKFNLKNDGAANFVRVNEMQFKGIYKTGTLTITPKSLSSGTVETGDCSLSWDGISNNGVLSAKIDVEIAENGTKQLFPDDNALLVIPQPDNHGVIVSITYTLIEKDVEDRQMTLTAEAPIGGWEYGKEYTYSAEIDEITKEISLKVSVKAWQGLNSNAGMKVPES